MDGINPETIMQDEQPPVVAFLPTVVASVEKNRVTIVVAATGAGKSTEIAPALMRAGYRVLITQPRRLAARSVGSRVAHSLGEDLGQRIGVRTRDDRRMSASTECLFVTTGIALQYLLNDSPEFAYDVLILDELHEWDNNSEVMVALLEQALKKNPRLRVVLMSATIETDKLATFFHHAPVIEVPGRIFPIVDRNPGRTIEADVVALVREQRNVLVFFPGKAEIEEFIRDLNDLKLNAVILPLHGELTPEEQDRCFADYSRPIVVVATNVAQTSITIPGIDAVVDSGMERRTDMIDGVQGLYLRSVSLADSRQRKGRAGRTKPGIYIDHCREFARAKYPKPEIERCDLAGLALSLANNGIDIEALRFYHQPSEESLVRAKEALRSLGCLQSKNAITAKGQVVARLPVAPKLGCMVVEAQKRGVLDDVLKVVAILESDGITWTKKDKETYEVIRKWLKLCPNEHDSDVIAQLLVFEAAEKMDPKDFPDKGIHRRNFFEAKATLRSLRATMMRQLRTGTPTSTGDRQQILLSVCAGMIDHLYESRAGMYVNGDRRERTIGHESVVSDFPAWIVGTPHDLEFTTKYGKQMRYLVNMVTKVDIEMLLEIAPHLFRVEQHLNPFYSPDHDCVLSTLVAHFRDRPIHEEVVEDRAHPDAAKLFAEWVASEMLG